MVCCCFSISCYHGLRENAIVIAAFFFDGFYQKWRRETVGNVETVR